MKALKPINANGRIIEAGESCKGLIPSEMIPNLLLDGAISIESNEQTQEAVIPDDPDNNSMTANELKSYIKTLTDNNALNELREQEEQGENRSSVIKEIEKRINELNKDE